MFRRFLRYFWGVLVAPKATLAELAQESSIHFAVLLAGSGLALTLLNLLLFFLFGYDWLGTRRELSDPTYVGFFGRVRLDTQNYISLFNFVLNPLLALLGLSFLPGIAQVLSKLWKGEGTFEQMVNTLVFAIGVPSIIISSLLNDLLLGGVLPNLLTGHPYAFTAAQTGELGPLIQTVWWIYILGIYIFAKDIWSVTLGTLAIQRVQKIPWLAAGSIMLLGYLLWYYGIAGTFVR